MPFPALLLWGAGAVAAGVVANKVVKSATGKSLVERSSEAMDEYCINDDKKICDFIYTHVIKRFYNDDRIEGRLTAISLVYKDSDLLEKHIMQNYGDNYSSKVEQLYVGLFMLLYKKSPSVAKKNFRNDRDFARPFNKSYLKSCLNKQANDNEELFKLAEELKKGLGISF